MTRKQSSSTTGIASEGGKVSVIGPTESSQVPAAAPVVDGHFLPAGRGINGSISVTGGRHENICSHAGYLYALHKGEARSHAMERGNVIHRVIELSVLAALEGNEPVVPPELVKAIADEVFADPEYRCPLEEQDYVRESAYRFAQHFKCVPQNVIAVEKLFQLDVGGFRFRGKIDYAELLEGGAAALVKDWKSSRSMPGWEEIGRKRSDGSIAAKDYQLVVYGLGVVFGRPIRVEACSDCGGLGVAIASALQESQPCPRCNGKGRIETVEPVALAGRAQRVDLEYAFPGIEFSEGHGSRGVSLTRTELHEYMESLAAQAARIQAQERSGKWPATPSSHCETECPAADECPLPKQRSLAGRLNTPEQVKEEAERQFVQDVLSRGVWKEIKAKVKGMDGQRLRFGLDRVIEAVPNEFDEIRDKDVMFAAIEEAANGGQPFDRSEHVVHRDRSPITVRKLSDEEMEASHDG